MDRKEFLKTSLAAAGVSALFPILNTTAHAPESNSCDAEREREHTFRDSWVIALLTNLDANLTPEQRVKVMEANGRACARRALKRLNEQKGPVLTPPSTCLWAGSGKRTPAAMGTN